MLNTIFRKKVYVVLTLLLTSCASQEPALQVDLAINKVSVVDVRTGTVREDRTLLVKNGKIVDSFPAGSKSYDATTVIAGDGRFAVPGLIDMHTHLDPGGLAVFLDYGVTTIRDMGTQTSALKAESGLLGARAAIARGERIGPRVFTPARILDGPVDRNPRFAPHFASLSTPAEAAVYVDELAAVNVDFVKVYTNLTPEVFDAIAERAAYHGLALAGHVPHLVGTRRGVQGGMITLEHLRGIFIDVSKEEAAFRAEMAEVIASRSPGDAYAHYHSNIPRLFESWDQSKADVLFDELAASGVAVVPTLVVLDDPRWRDPKAMPAPEKLAPFSKLYQRIMTPYGDPAGAFSSVEEAQRVFEVYQRIVRDLHKRGAVILAGTDAANPFVIPGDSLHRELELLVDSGLSEAQALRAATLAAAEVLGVADQVGVLDVGLEADLLLLDANPLQDIRATRRIEAVIVGGKVIRTGAGEGR